MPDILSIYESGIFPSEKNELRGDEFINFLMKAVPGAIFHLNDKGYLVGCNKSFEQLVIKDRNDIIGKTVHDIFPAAVAGLMEERFRALMKAPGIAKFIIEMPDLQGRKKHLLMIILSCVLFKRKNADAGMTVTGMVIGIHEIIRLREEIFARWELIQRDKMEQIMNHVRRLKNKLDCKRRELSVYLELLIHSTMVKEKLLTLINELRPYLNPEGKTKFFLTLKQVKWELNDEVRLGVENRFDELNFSLYQLLETNSPRITKNEKRLCAFLKMNHSSVEIAKITGKSLNSINVAFARLRTKLGFSSNKDIKAYITALESPDRSPLHGSHPQT